MAEISRYYTPESLLKRLKEKTKGFSTEELLDVLVESAQAFIEMRIALFENFSSPEDAYDAIADILDELGMPNASDLYDPADTA